MCYIKYPYYIGAHGYVYACVIYSYAVLFHAEIINSCSNSNI